GNAAEAAAVTAELPPAEESVGEARGAVTEPQEETAGRAQAGLVAALGERPAPSPEIEQLCDDIHEAISSKRPPDEQSLVRSDPSDIARSAGAQLNSAVEGDAQRVEGEYDPLETPPEGTPQQQPQPMEPPPASVETPDVNATAATPDGVPAENVSLDADVAASQARMDEAGMSTEPAQLVQSGPIAEARAAQGELAETAERDPAEVMAEQQATLSRASADMAALQQRALEALAGSRAATVQSTTGQQQAMVGSEEQQRAQISARAQGIFNAAQTQVTTLLQPLAQTAMSRWDAGVAILSTRFKSRLSEVEGWIRERHAGGWGAVVSVWDDLTGLPGWVIEAYDTAEKDFGDGVCELIREISIEVNGVVATCEALIAGARTEIDNLFANLPAELQEWAAGEQARLSGELDGLHGRVAEAQTSFNRDLVNRAANSVQEVRQQIHGLREKAKGLLGRVGDALARFAEDPAKFILEGLLELVGIPPAAFWALVARISSVIDSIADDPMNFANNLMAALGQGFQGFFDRIGTHLLQGLMDWLFSGLGSVGVTLPADFSLKSIITFFLQLMGITWPRIRQVLARHIGEENVALLEKAYELIANLIELGPEGLFEMIKEQLDPQAILDQVLQMAKDYIIQTVITQVTARIIALFNPAGAIVQAVEAIYRVLSWVFNNAARIFRLVETVVNGVADLIAGNTAGMARAVEAALAGMISPVIDFLAGYAGVGDLPEKIADGIRGLQDYVMGIVDRVIGWLAEKAKGLLKALGLGGDEEGEGGGGDFDGQIGKRVPVTATGGGHTLWIEVRGNSAKLVVQSAKQDLLDFLQGPEVRRAFSDQEGNLTEDHASVVQPAIALATRTELDASGVQALLETATQTADPADDEQVETKDDEVESEEVQLAGFLSQIFSRLQAGATDHLQLSTRVRSLKEQSYRLFQQLQRTRFRQEIDEIKKLAEEYHDVIDDRSFLQQLKPDIEALEGRLNSLVASLPPELRQAEEQAQTAAVPPRLAAARQGATLVSGFKAEGVGQEAGRSGGHGEPYKRAGAELVRRANQLPRADPMHEALKIEGNRLILRGTAISHRGGW
ncbi:MAG TPA: hypothetical protein VHN15_03040, partial [Thermoanaerobaculia bacterium]|nr:hypothetical protein [Thermoanaerobaculia bacterium]